MRKLEYPSNIIRILLFEEGRTTGTGNTMADEDKNIHTFSSEEALPMLTYPQRSKQEHTACHTQKKYTE